MCRLMYCASSFERLPMMMQKTGVLFIILTTWIPILSAQISQSDSLYYANYHHRIKQVYIDDVFIPADLPQAYEELIRLADPSGIDKFRHASEEVVTTKLRGGLERWIMINWGFEEGSRLSDLIKKSWGVEHPEDMASFVLIAFHRFLNQRPIDEASIAAALINRRLLINDNLYKKDSEQEYLIEEGK